MSKDSTIHFKFDDYNDGVGKKVESDVIVGAETEKTIAGKEYRDALKSVFSSMETFLGNHQDKKDFDQAKERLSDIRKSLEEEGIMGVDIEDDDAIKMDMLRKIKSAIKNLDKGNAKKILSSTYGEMKESLEGAIPPEDTVVEAVEVLNVENPKKTKNAEGTEGGKSGQELKSKKETFHFMGNVLKDELKKRIGKEKIRSAIGGLLNKEADLFYMATIAGKEFMEDPLVLKRITASKAQGEELSLTQEEKEKIQSAVDKADLDELVFDAYVYKEIGKRIGLAKRADGKEKMIEIKAWDQHVLTRDVLNHMSEKSSVKADFLSLRKASSTKTLADTQLGAISDFIDEKLPEILYSDKSGVDDYKEMVAKSKAAALEKKRNMQSATGKEVKKKEKKTEKKTESLDSDGIALEEDKLIRAHHAIRLVTKKEMGREYEIKETVGQSDMQNEIGVLLNKSTFVDENPDEKVKREYYESLLAMNDFVEKLDSLKEREEECVVCEGVTYIVKRRKIKDANKKAHDADTENVSVLEMDEDEIRILHGEQRSAEIERMLEEGNEVSKNLYEKWDKLSDFDRESPEFEGIYHTIDLVKGDFFKKEAERIISRKISEEERFDLIDRKLAYLKTMCDMVTKRLPEKSDDGKAVEKESSNGAESSANVEVEEMKEKSDKWNLAKLEVDLSQARNKYLDECSRKKAEYDTIYQYLLPAQKKDLIRRALEVDGDLAVSRGDYRKSFESYKAALLGKMHANVVEGETLEKELVAAKTEIEITEKLNLIEEDVSLRAEKIEYEKKGWFKKGWEKASGAMKKLFPSAENIAAEEGPEENTSYLENMDGFKEDLLGLMKFIVEAEKEISSADKTGLKGRKLRDILVSELSDGKNKSIARVIPNESLRSIERLSKEKELNPGGSDLTLRELINNSIRYVKSTGRVNING